MKNLSFSLLFLGLSVLSVSAQVGINTTSPDPSALLDLTSNNRGLLVPRMTTAERDAISAPAEGLQIYNTDCKRLNLYIGGEWLFMPYSPMTLSAQPLDSNACNSGNAAFSIIAPGSGLSYQWQENQGSGWNNISDGGTYGGTSSATLVISGLSNGMNGYQYRCLVNGDCGTEATSNAATLTVIDVPAQPGSISGSSSLVDNTTGENYSISAVAGATGYTWTAFAGATIASGQGTTNVTVDFTTTSGSICVTADNNCGSGTSRCKSITVSPPCSNFTDARDGNNYDVALIGSQCWMAENLAYLPSVVPGATGSVSTPYYYVHSYDGTSVSAAKSTSNYTTYGALYNYPAALTACPSGWHLPSDAEYSQLEEYLGMCSGTGTGCSGDVNWRGTNEGAKMKATSSWSGSGNGTNSSGFNALAAGNRRNTGIWQYIGDWTYLRTSTPGTGDVAFVRALHYSEDRVNRNDGIATFFSKDSGFSVRCLKD